MWNLEMDWWQAFWYINRCGLRQVDGCKGFEERFIHDGDGGSFGFRRWNGDDVAGDISEGVGELIGL